MEATLLSFLQKGLHKKVVDEIAADLLHHDAKMSAMVNFAIHEEGTVGMKASWILGAVSVMQHGAVNNYADAIISRLGMIQTMGIKRELLKTLLHSDILKEKKLGLLVDELFHLLRSSEVDISVSYNAMKLMQVIVKEFPELKPEYFDTLNHQLPYMSDTWRKLARHIISKG